MPVQGCVHDADPHLCHLDRRHPQCRRRQLILPTHKIIADGLQFPEGPVMDRDGSLLLVEIERRTVTRIAQDGSKTIVAQLEGGPNGMAWGPDDALYICNNGGFLFRKIDGVNRTTAGVPEGYAGGWIERADPKTGEHRVLYARCGD